MSFVKYVSLRFVHTDLFLLFNFFLGDIRVIACVLFCIKGVQLSTARASVKIASGKLTTDAVPLQCMSI